MGSSGTERGRHGWCEAGGVVGASLARHGFGGLFGAAQGRWDEEDCCSDDARCAVFHLLQGLRVMLLNWWWRGGMGRSGFG